MGSILAIVANTSDLRVVLCETASVKSMLDWGTLVCDAGLGFITSLLFVFFVAVLVSSWMGATVFWLGEWFIKRMP
ncbi:hypothetical protein L1049_014922 [Liquidambar formosana]|uniref:Uncharacterized protein n=1 Tax=Liquidambar formosana TaxID=63359 RepID=A0AAP0WZC2_LIQFO